jgi:hypothetical protein
MRPILFLNRDGLPSATGPSPVNRCGEWLRADPDQSDLLICDLVICVPTSHLDSWYTFHRLAESLAISEETP